MYIQQPHQKSGKWYSTENYCVPREYLAFSRSYDTMLPSERKQLTHNNWCKRKKNRMRISHWGSVLTPQSRASVLISVKKS